MKLIRNNNDQIKLFKTKKRKNLTKEKINLSCFEDNLS